MQRGQVELESILLRAQVSIPRPLYEPAFCVGFSILVRRSPLTELSGLRTSVSSGLLLSFPLCPHSISLQVLSILLPTQPHIYLLLSILPDRALLLSVSYHPSSAHFLTGLLDLNFFPIVTCAANTLSKRKSTHATSLLKPIVLSIFSQVGIPRSRFSDGALCTGSFLGRPLGFDTVTYIKRFSSVERNLRSWGKTPCL